ncbi:MAG TPA: biotin/lipoyl-containing protein, partial [Streptosporangiaceae bacterium]|nr:biotin/lipoyl-containing protein [Streptosporangiaceae bacterium]
LERLVERPRHIEVQVFADTHGQVVHLFERECSIQRRYQKILEESPSPVVDDTLRTELGSAAIAAAKAIGYVGAGTVEFILDASGEFFFLEVNTRLQVEHPVTELVTGLDLVALQLMVAEGKPLPDEAVQASLSGHAIEARLYAEDVAAGYLPATGSLLLFDVPSLPGVRIDTGVQTGGQVSVHYDPMLAKVIAHAPTREQAARLLARALAETRVLGVVTNRDLLVGILREQDFLDGHIDTGYLTRHDPATLMAGDERRLPVHALATALADQALRRAETSVLPGVPSGWRNVPNARQQAGYQVAERGFGVEYGIRGPFVDAAVDGVELGPVLLHGCTAAEVDLQIHGVRRLVAVARAGDIRYADSALGATTLVEQPRFPETQQQATAGSLLAPMPGTVVRVEARLGEAVHAGQVLVVLEAMKMEHPVRSPHEGTLARLNVSAGQSVDMGTVLAVVDNATGGPADSAGGSDGARD